MRCAINFMHYAASTFGSHGSTAIHDLDNNNQQAVPWKVCAVSVFSQDRSASHTLDIQVQS